MHDYDIALKSILRHLTGRALFRLTGYRVKRWRDTELVVAHTRRVDLLGETTDGHLLHIELQSTNDPAMATRMLEYAAAMNLQFGQLPEQVVLYVGREKLRMRSEIKSREWAFRCRMIDIRDLDGDELIAGRNVEDNVIAVLARLRDERAAIRRILRRIAKCTPQRRELALRELTVLAGLRNLAPMVGQETKQMPILEDIMDHPLFGPKIRKSLEIGLEQGREEGREEGERQLILRMLKQRFGPVPVSVRKRIQSFPSAKLEQVAMRLLEARTLKDVLN